MCLGDKILPIFHILLARTTMEGSAPEAPVIPVALALQQLVAAGGPPVTHHGCRPGTPRPQAWSLWVLLVHWQPQERHLVVVAAAPGGGAQRAVPAGWEDAISMSEDA